ncbi:MAG: hypothetical protein AAF050_15865 [Cyanobacteria bacterium J06649_5]
MSPRRPANRSIGFSRRQVMRGLLATAAFGGAVKLSGCSPSASTADGETAEGGAGEVVVGFIYVGPKDDFGYNQAHAEDSGTLASSTILMPGTLAIACAPSA